MSLKNNLWNNNRNFISLVSTHPKKSYMKKPLLLFVSLLLSYYCFSQNASIKGAITDTYNKQTLSNSTVLLLGLKIQF